MTKYKHLFFDLDHTLWDYERNSRDTLKDLYEEYDLVNLNKFSLSQFVKQFEKTNYKLWDQFNQGHIDKDFIRKKRFSKIFESFGLTSDDVPASLSDNYLNSCPQKTKVIPFSFEVLDYLKDKYHLHILTNGFSIVQNKKLNASKLAPYFNLVIDAESTAFKKPQIEIFDYAISKSKAIKQECIMIGDNLKTDIIGAKNAVVDQVYFNPKSLSHQIEVTYEVKCLSELKFIF